MRPELALVPESCADERRLHDALQLKPLRRVQPFEIQAIRDEDARSNYALFIQFRDAVIAAGSLEAWYAQLFTTAAFHLPPLFIDHAVQHISAALVQGEDALTQRASELLYRQQRVTVHDGRIISGDRQWLDTQQETGGLGDLGRLLLQNKVQVSGTQSQSLQVLGRENASAFQTAQAQSNYRHNWLLDLTHEQSAQVGPAQHSFEIRLARADSGLAALARVMELWVRHFKASEVRITSLAKIEDAAWRWHTGLDTESSHILNALYAREDVPPAQLGRRISLFRLDFTQPQDAAPEMRGKPTCLGLAMNEQGLLKLKPQNSLLNLPFAAHQ